MNGMENKNRSASFPRVFIYHFYGKLHNALGSHEKSYNLSFKSFTRLLANVKRTKLMV